MSRHNLGHQIVCDGKYKGEDGSAALCGAELHPGTQAVINKVGIMGHFCELCYDPAKAEALAKRLDMTMAELHETAPADLRKQIADLEKKEADQRAADAEKQRRQVELANKVQALKPDDDGKWPVEGVKEPFDSKKDAVDFLTKKSKNGGWPPQ